MDEMDDYRRTGLRRSRLLPWLVLGVVVAVGAGVALWLRQRTPPAPETLEGPAPAAPAPAAAPSPEAGTAAPTPQQARSLFDAISPSSRFRSLLTGDLVRRWAVLTANLALGESPRHELGALAPRGAFEVVNHGGRTFIAPASYRRYDDFAAIVASIDAQAVARAYRALHAPLEAAYRGLGYPHGSLDEATSRALRRIEEAPVPSGEVEVVAGEAALYRFRDSRLEALGAAEKHLLRMGPRNGGLIQAKAREIDQALDLR